MNWCEPVVGLSCMMTSALTGNICCHEIGVGRDSACIEQDGMSIGRLGASCALVAMTVMLPILPLTIERTTVIE